MPGPGPGTVIWIARSATTGHVAHGSTEDSAIERLFTGIGGLIALAIERDGVTPDQWFERSCADEPGYLSEFLRLADETGTTKLPAVAGPGGVRIERMKVSLAPPR